MTTKAENKVLTQVGPGTPMGELMRQYWVPIIHGVRLVSDGEPVKIRVLGQDLVAFRDTNGRAAVLDERCPHRGAPLSLGRNEACGLRCIYHGWKIDSSGLLVDAPNVAPGARLDRIATGYHPTKETSGVVWAWLGDHNAAPELPNYPFVDLPEERVHAAATTVDCSWLQYLENLWDPFHAAVLHSTTEAESFGDASTSFYPEAFKVPTELKCEETRYGWDYSAIDETKIIRLGFSFPWYVFQPTGTDVKDGQVVTALVPVDDEHMVTWHFVYNVYRDISEGGNIEAVAKSFTPPYEFLARFKNDTGGWTQDRVAMANGSSFTGIGRGERSIGILMEDSAVLEGMGPIVDRSLDHLCPTDAIVVHGRRALLNAIDAHQRGERLPGTGDEVATAEASTTLLSSR